MGRIFKYISGTWILSLPLMVILTYANIIVNDSEDMSSIGYVLLCFIPLVIGLMIVTLPALLITYGLTLFLFRLQATTTERYVLMHFFIQVSVVANILICLALVSWSFDSSHWEWPLYELKIFWPAYVAAALAGLIRFKAFIQLTEDLKPVKNDNDLV